MAPDPADEPLAVDGMAVTTAAELPPEVGDVSSYKPVRKPVTMYQRFGRGRTDSATEEPQADGEAALWSESLRRQLANDGHPKRPVFDLRCDHRRRHRLLWLVRSPWGLVPISHTAEEPDDPDPAPELTWTSLGGNPIVRKQMEPEPGRFASRFHGVDLMPGRPLTLGAWPADLPLPTASCPCYAEVVLTVAEARDRLARRDETYRRSGPTV